MHSKLTKEQLEQIREIISEAFIGRQMARLRGAVGDRSSSPTSGLGGSDRKLVSILKTFHQKYNGLRKEFKKDMVSLDLDGDDRVKALMSDSAHVADRIHSLTVAVLRGEDWPSGSETPPAPGSDPDDPAGDPAGDPASDDRQKLPDDTPLSLTRRQKVSTEPGGAREQPLFMQLQKQTGISQQTAQKLAQRLAKYFKQRGIPVAEGLDMVSKLVMEHQSELLLEDTITNQVRKSILGKLQSLMKDKASPQAKDHGAQMVIAMHRAAKSGDPDAFRELILKWSKRTGASGARIGGWVATPEGQTEFENVPRDQIEQLMQSLLNHALFQKYHQAGFDWRKQQKADKASARSDIRDLAPPGASPLDKILSRFISDNRDLLEKDPKLKDIFSSPSSFQKFSKYVKKALRRQMVRRGQKDQVARLLEHAFKEALLEYKN